MLDISELSEEKKKALPYFAQSADPKTIQTLSGISRTTYHTWMNEAPFKKCVDELRNNVVESAIDRLKVASEAIISKIVDLAENGESQTVQLRACDSAFDKLTKWMEFQNIASRLSTIEAILKEKKCATPSQD